MYDLWAGTRIYQYIKFIRETTSSIVILTMGVHRSPMVYSISERKESEFENFFPCLMNFQCSTFGLQHSIQPNLSPTEVEPSSLLIPKTKPPSGLTERTAAWTPPGIDLVTAQVHCEDTYKLRSLKTNRRRPTRAIDLPPTGLCHQNGHTLYIVAENCTNILSCDGCIWGTFKNNMNESSPVVWKTKFRASKWNVGYRILLCDKIGTQYSVFRSKTDSNVQFLLDKMFWSEVINLFGISKFIYELEILIYNIFNFCSKSAFYFGSPTFDKGCKILFWKLCFSSLLFPLFLVT